MSVLALTIFVSSLLAGMFTLLWVFAASDTRALGERDALLPLEDDSPAAPPAPRDPKP